MLGCRFNWVIGTRRREFTKGETGNFEYNKQLDGEGEHQLTSTLLERERKSPKLICNNNILHEVRNFVVNYDGNK